MQQPAEPVVVDFESAVSVAPDHSANRVEKWEEKGVVFTLAGVVAFQPNLPLAGLKGQLLYEKLTSAGEIRYFSPSAEKLEEMEELAAIEFGLVAGAAAVSCR